MIKTISTRLFQALQRGRERLSKQTLGELVRYVESQRTEADTFQNKSGGEDLYYTLFGWMLSYVLGIKLSPQKMTAYLEKIEVEEIDLVHYAALLRCRMIASLYRRGMLGTLIASFKTKETKKLEDFSLVPHNDSQSPYSQFIWLAMLEDTNAKVDKKEMLRSLSKYRVASGGYANQQGGSKATSNATAAALNIIDSLSGYKANEDIDFLRSMQEEYGGFKAAEDVPIADLLTTATALFTLKNYGVQPTYDAQEFVEAHWLGTGGFSPTLLDEETDVEYTFYGLLAMGTI